MKLLLETNTWLLNISLLLLRCTVGIILFVGGAGKVFGSFGGMGLKTTIDMFHAGMSIANFWIYVSCYTELIGGLLLTIGLFTRPAALALTINMLVAVIIVGFKNFFMGGAAYPFSLMIGSFIVLLAGPMDYSMDKILFGWKVKHSARQRQVTA